MTTSKQLRSPWLELVVLGDDCECSVPRKILLGIKAVPSYGGYLPPQCQNIVPLCDGEEANQNRTRIAKSEETGYYSRQTQMYWNWRNEMDEAQKWLRPPEELKMGNPPHNLKGQTKPKWRSQEVNNNFGTFNAAVDKEVAKSKSAEERKAKAWLRMTSK